MNKLIAGSLLAVGAAAAAGLALARQDMPQQAQEPVYGPTGGNQPVVVELFTSQGCSSCPPADEVLEKLARDPSLVAIARPVTYWDRLGWKDTLALQQNTDLQRAYSENGLIGAGVYTPQLVVQGGEGAVGSNQGAVRRLIARAKAKPGPQLSVGGGSVTVAGNKGSGTVTLVAVKSSVNVTIGSGENGGRQVRYVNVVRAERSLGRWNGGTQKFNIAPELLKTPGADRYAVIVQNGQAGPILTGRWL